MQIDARKEIFEEITVCGKPALFSNFRLLPETIPPYLHRYDVRDCCDGIPCEIKPYVLVNHMGTILTAEPMPLDENGSFTPTEESWNFAPYDGEPDPIARIDYLGMNGAVRESKEHWDQAALKKEIQEINDYGEPFSLVVYTDKNDKPLCRTNWIADLDPPPNEFHYEPAPQRIPCTRMAEFAEKYVSETVRAAAQKQNQREER